MIKNVDVIIIGTGTAALSAAAQVRRKTRNFIIISNGVYGTTCIRAGCMPSKVLINAAEAFHFRHHMKNIGIRGADAISLDSGDVMKYVRKMREHYLSYIMETTESYRKFIIEGEAYFIAPDEIELNDEIYKTRATIIATGSKPHIPAFLKGFEDLLITTDDLFEIEKLPSSIAVMGLSILGTEMAQCFARLGIKTAAYSENSLIGGMSDPEVSAYAEKLLGKEFSIKKNIPEIKREGNGVSIEGESFEKIFVAESRSANLDGMGLEELGIRRPGLPIIDYNENTMQVGNWPIFIAGDVKQARSILNQAVDEGVIAGKNAVADKLTAFKRRTHLQICYTDPVLAVSGRGFSEQDEGFKTGSSNYEDQGRAKIMSKASGMINIYADKSGLITGAEMFAPSGEGLAHMMSFLVARETTVEQALELPFYHPTIEEGIHSALKDLSKKI